MLINVDCDGVLLSNIHEDLLLKRIKEESYSFADSSQIFDWYTKLVDTTLIKVNHPLMRFLSTKRDEGHYLKLWTNRMYTLKNATMRNLGNYKSLFDSFEFHSGRKSTSQVEGIVIDNASPYLSCGEHSVLYPTFR